MQQNERLKDQTPPHRFSADRPITSHKEDLLGRSNFAESLASAIKGWKGNDSLVIALYGAWGSGKSSIKNMTIETLRKAKDDCLPIVEFNPWQWAGQDQLAEAFFREIGVALGKTDTSKAGKKRAMKWRAYAANLKVGSFIASGFRKAIVRLLVIFGIVGMGISLIDSPLFKLAIFIISIIALLGAGVFKWLGTFSEHIAAAFEARSEASSQSLPELKSELAQLLRELTIPILVVIDDIDRLSSDEIKLLFQLVKANADFPNLVYLLLFQRNIVEKSLATDAPITGREFLEKIVQVGFDIPRIERTRLEKVLFAGLDEAVLVDEQMKQQFDKQRWGNIFIGALRPYFETLRDVHRYIATLSFQAALFRNRESFEVNSVDLITLEALRVFDPEVYHQLPGAKNELTKQRDHGLYGQKFQDESKRVVEAIVDQAPEARRQQVRDILKQLFPPAEWVFGGHGYGSGFEETWFRERRVCHSDVFDRYFYLTIPEGDISQADLDRVLSIVGNREGLVAELRALNQRGLLSVVLDRLEAYKQKIDLQHGIPFVSALFDIGDDLPDEPREFFSIGADMHASRIIHWYLKQEKDAGKRGQILKEAVKVSEGLYLPIMTASFESDPKEREKNPDYFSVTDDDLKELHKICVEKIQNAAKAGTLAIHPKLLYILYRWREWASAAEPRKWVEGVIGSKEGLLSFLTAFLQRSTSHGMGDYVSREHWFISLKVVEDFIPAEVLNEKVAQLTLEGLGEKEQKAVRAFQKAMKRRQEGRPEGDRMGMDDEED